MPTHALGIDLAGDKASPTGIVEVVVHDGVVHVTDALVLVGERDRLLERCIAFEGDIAIDQPFGYSRHHEALIAGTKVDRHLDAEQIRFREVDRLARDQLAEAGLKRDYVLAATSCDNLWRALLILQAANVDLRQARSGVARIVETHPRLAIFSLLQGDDQRSELVRTYKSGRARDEARAVRAALIDEWLEAGWLCCESAVFVEALSRTDDVFEALVAALAALAKTLNIAERLGDPEEGVYVLPPRLAVLRRRLEEGRG